MVHAGRRGTLLQGADTPSGTEAERRIRLLASIGNHDELVDLILSGSEDEVRVFRGLAVTEYQLQLQPRIQEAVLRSIGDGRGSRCPLKILLRRVRYQAKYLACGSCYMEVPETRPGRIDVFERIDHDRRECFIRSYCDEHCRRPVRHETTPLPSAIRRPSSRETAEAERDRKIAEWLRRKQPATEGRRQ